MMILVMLVSAAIFLKILPSKQERVLFPQFRKDRVMDYLCALTIIIFFVCAAFLTFDPTKHGASAVNETSTRIVSAWTSILAVAILTRRWHSNRAISA